MHSGRLATLESRLDKLWCQIGAQATSRGELNPAVSEATARACAFHAEQPKAEEAQRSAIHVARPDAVTLGEKPVLPDQQAINEPARCLSRNPATIDRPIGAAAE